MKEKKNWDVKASEMAKNTFNPIRSIVDTMDINPHPEKPMISLSIGDPTIFGNLNPDQVIIDAITESVQSMEHNGYAPCSGYAKSRDAVARHYTTPQAPISASDVILCSGCSHALELSISSLASRGQTILVPRPGFSIYRTLAEGLGIKTKFYNLLPDLGWEVDLKHLEAQIDYSTAAIVINNPSNPCGSVYSAQHLRKILRLLNRYRVPAIADEIYDNFVFEGHAFHPLSSLTTEVPILTCGGLTKRYLVPGWRMGWIIIHDRNDIFAKEIRGAIQSLSQRIIGSNTLVQGALPAILDSTPENFFRDTIKVVEKNCVVAYEKLSQVPGLKPIMPAGAMYMMVGVQMEYFPCFNSDLHLVERLVSEQSVFCLPGKCFDYPDYVRLVLTIPEEQIREACDRIASFCSDHYRIPEQKTKINKEVKMASIGETCHRTHLSSN